MPEPHGLRRVAVCAVAGGRKRRVVDAPRHILRPVIAVQRPPVLLDSVGNDEARVEAEREEDDENRVVVDAELLGRLEQDEKRRECAEDARYQEREVGQGMQRPAARDRVVREVAVQEHEEEGGSGDERAYPEHRRPVERLPELFLPLCRKFQRRDASQLLGIPKALHQGRPPRENAVGAGLLRSVLVRC
eukprot:754969-Hanusia_phi.AAC.3